MTTQPKVSLTYNPVSGEFTIKVTNTTQITYTLEYEWENDEESGTDALTNQLDAESGTTITDTQLAGTESSGDSFVHQVTKGKLALEATGTDEEVLTYQNNFKITEAGTVKIISEETATKSDVLGETIELAPSPQVRAVTAPPTPLPSTTEVATEAPSAQTPSPATIGMIVVGASVILLGLIGGWLMMRRRSK